MLRVAGTGDRAAFLRLLEELLPLEISDRLYGSACALLLSLVVPARASEIEGRAP